MATAKMSMTEKFQHSYRNIQDLGHNRYSVPSNSATGAHHVVVYDTASREVHCDCTGYFYRGHCVHGDAVKAQRMAFDRAEAKQAERAEAERIERERRDSSVRRTRPFSFMA